VACISSHSRSSSDSGQHAQEHIRADDGNNKPRLYLKVSGCPRGGKRSCFPFVPSIAGGYCEVAADNRYVSARFTIVEDARDA
jgi:hypothetical protein